MPFKIEKLYMSSISSVSNDDGNCANVTTTTDYTNSTITDDINFTNQTNYENSTTGYMNNTNERNCTNSVASPVYVKWPHSNGACMLWLFADMVACTASIWNLAAIALDRLLVRLNLYTNSARSQYIIQEKHLNFMLLIRFYINRQL